MPTYFVGNPPDYPQLPLLEFFTGLNQEGCTSGTKLVGTLEKISDLDALVPAANCRIELEHAEGEEEVRVVDETTGEFHRAKGDAALSILKEMDARQAVNLKEDGNYPGGHRRPDLHDLVYISYDEDGKRIWPALRLGGICHTKEEFESHVDGREIWDEKQEQDTCNDYILVIDTRTGDFWVADDDLTKQIREGRKERKAQHMKDHPEDFEDGEYKCG